MKLLQLVDEVVKVLTVIRFVMHQELEKLPPDVTRDLHYGSIN